MSDRGWWFPLNARKAHYFREGENISLCQRWMTLAQDPDSFEPETGKPSISDCAGCRRRLDKEGVR